MKTPSQIRQSVLVLALCLFPLAGHCFYNPNTGRWLNRDPAQEPAGKNLYGFVVNNAVGNIDATGLCRCGPDVTEALNAVLNAVQGTFYTWNTRQAKSACTAIIGWNPDVDFQHAWDIDELAYDTEQWEHFMPRYSNPIHKGEGPGCRYTVQVHGGCFDAAQVNFALFGKMYSLCARAAISIPFDPFNTIPLDFWIINWKWYRYHQTPQDREVIEALDFAHYGFGDSTGNRVALPECALSGQTFAGPFNWTWEPMRHRRPVGN